MKYSVLSLMIFFVAGTVYGGCPTKSSDMSDIKYYKNLRDVECVSDESGDEVALTDGGIDADDLLLSVNSILGDGYESEEDNFSGSDADHSDIFLSTDDEKDAKSEFDEEEAERDIEKLMNQVYVDEDSLLLTVESGSDSEVECEYLYDENSLLLTTESDSEAEQCEESSGWDDLLLPRSDPDSDSDDSRELS